MKCNQEKLIDINQYYFMRVFYYSSNKITESAFYKCFSY